MEPPWKSRAYKHMLTKRFLGCTVANGGDINVLSPPYPAPQFDALTALFCGCTHNLQAKSRRLCSGSR